jgi:hypothetical protein
MTNEEEIKKNWSQVFSNFVTIYKPIGNFPTEKELLLKNV